MVRASSRWSIVVILLVVMAGAPLLASLSTQAVAQPTGELVLGRRGDAGQTGRMSGNGPATQPGVIWEVSAGQGGANAMAIRDDLLFYTSRTPSVVGAIDRMTGTLVWTADLGAEAWAYAPEPAGELVVVAVRMSEGDHVIVAFEAATGVEAWRISVQQAPSAVTHANGIIYAPTEWASTPPNTIATLHALDAATGNQLWEFSDPDALKFNQVSVSDGIVVATGTSLANNDVGAYALDADSGELLWTFTEDDGVNRPAVIWNGIVILHALPWVWGVDLQSGAILWEVTGASAGGGIAMGPETAYIGFEDELRAINPVDGSTRWTTPVSGIVGPPTVTSNLVYTGVWRREDDRGPHMLHAFDASSGAEAWSLELEHFITTNHPLAHDGMLYIDANTSVVAFGDASSQTGGAATEPAPESAAYASPEFGHTIAWNAPWSLSQPQSWAEPGQDFVTLVSGDANLALRATSGVGSPQQFIEFYASSTQVGENAEVVTSTDGADFSRAVARFTVDGASYIEYVEVRTLPGGNGVFLTIMLAPEDGFSQAHQTAQHLVTVDQQPPFRAAPSLPGG